MPPRIQVFYCLKTNRGIKRFLNARFLKQASVESYVLTPKDDQKNGDTNVKTKFQITMANQQKSIKQRAKLK